MTLMRLPTLPSDGPQKPIDVLVLFEQQRLKRPVGIDVYAHAQLLMHIGSTLLINVCAGRASSALSAPQPSSPSLSKLRPLLLLVASHVRSEARLTRLRNCLASIAAQEGSALAAVLVSWSAEPSLRAAVRTALSAAQIPELVANERPRPFKQFEHYAALAVEAEELLGRRGLDAREAWVTFCDDDDLLHPARSACYAAAIRGAPATTQAVSAAWTARPVVAEIVETAGQAALTPARSPAHQLTHGTAHM